MIFRKAFIAFKDNRFTWPILSIGRSFWTRRKTPFFLNLWTKKLIIFLCVCIFLMLCLAVLLLLIFFSLFVIAKASAWAGIQTVAYTSSYLTVYVPANLDDFMQTLRLYEMSVWAACLDWFGWHWASYVLPPVLKCVPSDSVVTAALMHYMW